MSAFVWFGTNELPFADQRLILAYRETGVPIDSLAYSEAFELLFRRIEAAGDTRNRQEIFHRLLNLRKAGYLPRLEFSQSA